MSRPAICCVDDQPEVLAAVVQDLQAIGDQLEVVGSSDPTEVPGLLEEMLDNGLFVAVLVCDQVMPETSGVELLADLRDQPRLAHLRTCLLTGLATHEDTIRAINDARIDHYIAKPWDPDELRTVVRRLLTAAVFDAGIDHLPLLPVLDQQAVFEHLRRGG